jgi:hypothetical protein
MVNDNQIYATKSESNFGGVRGAINNSGTSSKITRDNSDTDIISFTSSKNDKVNKKPFYQAKG